MGKYAGNLYVCSFGMVNCRICRTADHTETRKARAKELKTQRAEAYRFRNSPRLVIITPKAPTPSAPAPALYRTVTQAMVEDEMRYPCDTQWVFADLIDFGTSKTSPETAKHSKDISPADVIRNHSENEWRERTWGKRSN